MLDHDHANKDNINLQTDEIIGLGEAFLISLNETLPIKFYYG